MRCTACKLFAFCFNNGFALILDIKLRDLHEMYPFLFHTMQKKKVDAYDDNDKFYKKKSPPPVVCALFRYTTSAHDRHTVFSLILLDCFLNKLLY